MIERLIAWLKNDKTNNFWAIISAFITILPYALSKLETVNFPNNGLLHATAQVLFILAGLIVVATKYRSYAFKELENRRALRDYIEEECRIKQTADNTSHAAVSVVRITVRQFFYIWIMVWTVWLLYYMADWYYWSGWTNRKDAVLVTNMTGIKSLLDFLGSTLMFMLYLVLNEYTVHIENRSRKQGINLLYNGIYILALFLICLLLFSTYASCPTLNIVYSLYVKVILSTFSCISFALVLGKFNSHYLNVPRFMMLSLYFYAVAQAFSFLVGDPSSAEKVILFSCLNPYANEVIPWITICGKIMLLITLSCILDEKRLIFFIVRRSLSMTKVNDQLSEFNRYME